MPNNINCIKNSSFKNLARILVFAFVISLVPILLVSFFAHPNYDDYGFSASLHNSIKNGEGFLGAINAIQSTMQTQYNTWQGNYSATFLGTLQPGIISNNAYFITTFLLIGSFIFCELALYKTLIVKILKQDLYIYIIISMLLLLIKIQFIPSSFDAFYWYDGGIAYLFFYNLALLLISRVINILIEEKKVSLIKTALVSFLAFFIAGGNYLVVLQSFLIILLITFYCFYKKNPNRINILLINFALLIGFIIALIAPGNSLRQTNFEKYTAIEAIYHSIELGFKFVLESNLKITNILFWIFLSPFIYNIAKKSNYNFKYPIIFIIISFGIYASQWAPPLYAMRGIAGYRHTNLFFISYYWFMLLSLFYIYGYIAKHNFLRKLANLFGFMQNKVIICTIVFAIGILLSARGQGMLSLLTGKAIINGEVKEYDMQMKNMISTLENSIDDIVYVDDVTTIPAMFNKTGLSEDPKHWVNTGYALYFGHTGVAIK